jgi:hypothetical protein
MPRRIFTFFIDDFNKSLGDPIPRRIRQKSKDLLKNAIDHNDQVEYGI